ncbi:hypothetical protein BU17DRAFT_41980 [Hysterangium stoloniferum]|nr:hypothetical protein BU17DRAFT_41980 [Hysterangium stoloniferum]
MPAPNPFPTSQGPPQPVPSLNLFPLNDSFIPKFIHLNQRVKIGRQTNAKSVPGERNGYFDSKVLSRQHAEVWEEDGKIFIKDVKSSNGTFINGERLSPEGVESQPFELKTDDIVEFGIDIVGEDNKTIVHHKVAARVTCVLSPDDALAAPPPSTAFQPNKRPNTLAPPAPNNPAAGLGSMGAPAGRPGATKSGLTFDHILTRLQNGLNQSRETGQELGRLGDQMNDINDTLSGTNPGPIHSYPQTIPPVRPPIPETVPSQQPHPPVQPTVPSQAPSEKDKDTLISLQTQLAETQSTLSAHVEKIRALSGLAQEYEAMKREMGALRNMIGGGLNGRKTQKGREDEEEEDDDETKSMVTVTPGQEEEEQEREREAEEERREGLSSGRPRTPEPMQGYRSEQDHEQPLVSINGQLHHSLPRQHSPQLEESSQHNDSASVPPTVASRINVLSDQLEAALSISRTLQAQQSAAQNTIQLLEAKIVALEARTAPSLEEKSLDELSKRQAPDPQQPDTDEPPQPPTFTHSSHHQSPILSLVKEWGTLRDEWRQWEGRMKTVEVRVSGVENSMLRVEGSVQRVEGGLKNVESGLKNVEDGLKSGGRDGSQFKGLVTPPSPRSLSADSDRVGRRSRSRAEKGKEKEWEGENGIPNGNGNAVRRGSRKGSVGSVSGKSDDGRELARGTGDIKARQQQPHIVRCSAFLFCLCLLTCLFYSQLRRSQQLWACLCSASSLLWCIGFENELISAVSSYNSPTSSYVEYNIYCLSLCHSDFFPHSCCSSISFLSSYDRFFS